MRKITSFFTFGGDPISSIGTIGCQLVEYRDTEQAGKLLFNFHYLSAGQKQCFARFRDMFSAGNCQTSQVATDRGYRIFLQDKILSLRHGCVQLAQCADPSMDAGVTEFPFWVC